MSDGDPTLALDELLVGIDDTFIEPVFQPVADLRLHQRLGYELLSRGPEPFREPAALFERAGELSMMWELERACRLAALHAIAALPLATRLSSLFFLNISPDVLHDPRFVSGFTLAALQELGIRRDNIVIEITERTTIADDSRFEQAIRHYSRQGFRIALDDFGSGHSGLVTLIRCEPQFLKLDMAITRRVDADRYKQKIIKSVVALAENIGATLIAEGVETEAELDTLRSLGVCYAQGFLLGRPLRGHEVASGVTGHGVAGSRGK
jgi:EAL domain-containing protein (putative c-di-GMP-specific phosphodiesterase class I)